VLSDFMRMRDEVSKELMRLEGRADYCSAWLCPGILPGGSRCSAAPRFRCRECVRGALWCATCIVACHEDSPFHPIEVRSRTGVLEACSDRLC
jgi:hypothetical protein